MICTFGDTTDVTWWRELDLPTRAIIGRDGRILADTPAWIDRRRPAAYAHDRRPDRRSRRRPPSSSCSRESGELLGEPRPITAPGEVLRARRPPARDRHQPPVVHPQRRPRRRSARRARSPAASELALASRPHAPPLRELGRGAQRRLARSAASASSACRSRSGTRSTPTASPTTTSRSLPDESTLPIDPSTDVPAGYTADQRGQPGGFVGDPDVMDTWATSSLTPQIAGCWEDDPDLFAPRLPDGHAPAGPTTSSARGCSPPSCAATTSTARCRGANAAIIGLDPRPRPQEDVEVEGQRRHADGPVRAVRHRRRALLGGVGPARRRHRVRRGPDEGRPQARHQAAQRHQVRARHSASRHATDAVADADPLDLAMLRPARRRRSTRRPRRSRLRLRPRARAHRGVLLVVLRRLRRAGQGPRLRLAGRRSRARRRGAALRTALDALQRLLAPILPFATEEVVELVARRQRPRRRVADADRRRPATRRLLDPVRRGAQRWCAGRRPRPRSASAPTVASLVVSAPPTRCTPRSNRAVPTSPTRDRSPRCELRVGDSLSCETVLATTP